MFIMGIMLSILPCVLILFINNKIFNKFLLSGIIACALSYVIEKQLVIFFNIIDIKTNHNFDAFIIAALTEELLKYFTLLFLGCFNKRINFFIGGLILGIGFGCFENILYSFGYYTKISNNDLYISMVILRFCMPLVLHVLLGAILMQGYTSNRIKPIGSIFFAIFAHGLYDSLSFPYCYIFLVLIFFYVSFIFKSYRLSNTNVLP